MRRSTLLAAAAAGAITSAILSLAQSRAWAHCEIPCGIYGDSARINQMLEDTTTIERAVVEIQALAGKLDAQSLNQITRWVSNKETHATKIQETIAQYFLNQRVKPAAEGSPGWNDYVQRLVRHHAVMVAAMKTKQSVEKARVDELRAAIEAIGIYYPSGGVQPTTAPHGP